MDQKKSLQEFLQESKGRKIDAIAQYIKSHISENWRSVFEENYDKLMDAYIKAGDMAYGTYLNLLFLPVHKQLKEAGLRPEPRLPGEMSISREWGNTDDFTEQERWMWSTITSIENNEPLGTIVIVVHHDHTQLRVSHQPEVIAFTETSKEDVVEVLSKRSENFKNAREFQIEIAQYLKKQG